MKLELLIKQHYICNQLTLRLVVVPDSEVSGSLAVDKGLLDTFGSVTFALKWIPLN